MQNMLDLGLCYDNGVKSFKNGGYSQLDPFQHFF